MLLVGALIIIAVGIFFWRSSANENSSDEITNGSGVQKIVLSMKDFNYYPNTIYVKAGKPVSISLDDSVGGCYRSIVISSLGLRKTLKSSSDTLDFTPKEKGTYRFACSMGMGTGTLIVE